jgi:hypothetical protein
MQTGVGPALVCRRSYFVGSLAMLLAAATIGCDKSKQRYETAEVKGTVMFKGKGLTGGRIVFCQDEGALMGDGVIEEDGTYTVKGAPVGPVHILVDNSGLKQKGVNRAPLLKNPNQEGPTQLKGKFVQLPDKYATREKTDLTYTVVSGPQTHEVVLGE